MRSDPLTKWSPAVAIVFGPVYDTPPFVDLTTLTVLGLGLRALQSYMWNRNTSPFGATTG